MKTKTPDQKTVTIGSKSLDAMWSKLAERHQEETPPPGSLSAQQFAEKFGIPLKDARSRLVTFADSGELTAKIYRTRVNGCVRGVTFYTPKA